MNIFIGLLEPGYRIPYFDKMVRQQLSEEGTVSGGGGVREKCPHGDYNRETNQDLNLIV